MTATLSIGFRLLEAAGWAALHSLWQGALLAVCLALTLRALPPRAARWRYGASYAALLLVASLPVLGVCWLLAFPVPASVVAPPVAAGAMSLGGRLADLGPFVRSTGALWLVIAIAATMRWAGGWLQVRQLASRSVPATPQWTRRLDELAERMDLARPVRLACSVEVAVPTVIGHRQPTVLVPPSVLNDLSPRELSGLLAHELAHVARRDFAANLLQRLCEAILAFHPAAPWISRLASEERENACDDLAVAVIGDPLLYGRGLARLEEQRRERSLAMPASTLAANGGSLLRRVRRLDPRHRHGPPRLALAGSALAVLLLALLSATSAALYPVTHALLTSAPVTDSTLYTIRAHDPAGEFTVVLRGEKAVAATVAGERIPSHRLEQDGDRLTFLDEEGAPVFDVSIRPGGGISWQPRSPTS